MICDDDNAYRWPAYRLPCVVSAKIPDNCNQQNNYSSYHGRKHHHMHQSLM